MKIIVLILTILFILLLFKILSSRIIQTSTNKNKETTIDLEKDPKTKEYKPKE